jgi:hypothetical protein
MHVVLVTMMMMLLLLLLLFACIILIDGLVQWPEAWRFVILQQLTRKSASIKAHMIIRKELVFKKVIVLHCCQIAIVRRRVSVVVFA